MSLRKPKSVVIRNLDEDSDENDAILKQNGPVTDKKIRRNRIKFGSLEEDEDEYDEEMEDFKLKEKVKEKRKGKGLNIPLFGLDDEFDIQESKQESEIDYTDDPIIIALPDEEEQDDFISLEPSKHVTFDTKEYISVVSPDDASDEEDKEMNETYDQLDDGRLPLSSREASLQKKMHDMEIKEAIYDVEISEDEEMTDWTADKMRQGGIHSQTTLTNILPKINLPNDTFSEQLNKVQDTLSALGIERDGLSESMVQLDIKTKRFEEQMTELKRKLELIGSMNI